MKKLFKIIIASMCVSSVVSSTITSNTTYIEAKTVKKPKLSKTSLELKEGDSATLRLNNAIAKKVKWYSSNKKVATVSSKGKIKAISFGNVIITAKYKNKSYKCKITVDKAVVKKQLDIKYISSEIIAHTEDNCDVIKYTNNNDYDVDMTLSIEQYDSDGNVISTRSKIIKCQKNSVTYSYCIPHEKQNVISIEETQDITDVSSLETKYEIEKYPNHDDYYKLSYYVINPDSKNVSCNMIMIYYDKDMNALGIDGIDSALIPAKSNIQSSFDINKRVTHFEILLIPCGIQK